MLCGAALDRCVRQLKGTSTGPIGDADIVAVPAPGNAAGEWAEIFRVMRDGKTYANVHTKKHPGGEIRGQVK